MEKIQRDRVSQFLTYEEILKLSMGERNEHADELSTFFTDFRGSLLDF